MFSHLRILAAATGALILFAAAHSVAAAPSPVIRGETRMTAPVELQQAQVRAATGASFRVVAGY